MRHLADAAAYFAPELEVLELPGLGLPALRPRLARRCAPSSERLATLHALQRKADKPQLLVTTVNAATQRTLTPFRIRQLVARLAPGERIDLRQLVGPAPAPTAMTAPTPSPMPANMRCAAASSTCSRPGESEGAAARFLRRRDRERPPLRPGHPAHHRHGRAASPCSPPPRPCSTRTASSASARATASGSAPPRPATRSTRRCRTGGGSPASTIGCPCSRSGWRPCSTISATTTSSSATPTTPAPPTRASRRSPIITRTGSAPSRPIRAATGRSSPRRSICRARNGRR